MTRWTALEKKLWMFQVNEYARVQENIQKRAIQDADRKAKEERALARRTERIRGNVAQLSSKKSKPSPGSCSQNSANPLCTEQLQNQQQQQQQQEEEYRKGHRARTSHTSPLNEDVAGAVLKYQSSMCVGSAVPQADTGSNRIITREAGKTAALARKQAMARVIGAGGFVI